MAVTTLGRQMLKQALPDKFKGRAQSTLNAKEITRLATDIARDDPQGYVDVLQNLDNLGQQVVSGYGRQTGLTLDDIDNGAQVKNLVKKFQALTNKILDDPKLTNEQKEQRITQIGYKYTDRIKQQIVDDHKKRNTALYSQLMSGSRGNPMQLTQLGFGNLGVRDAMNRDIPYFGASPYASGASPFAYWVGASSSRKGFYDTQALTGQAGYLGKQASNATHSLPIAELDCGTTNTGMPVKANEDAVGSVLLRPFKKYPAGSVVTENMLADASDDDQLIVRSPLTCRSAHGVCAHCSGINENGKFPAIGEYVALNSAKTFIEKATQAGVGCLDPGTPVRMADWSIKRIKDLKVGDMIMGADIQGTIKPAKVTHIFDQGIVPMYLSTYTRGWPDQQHVVLQSTLNHKALQLIHDNGKQINVVTTVGVHAAQVYMLGAKKLQTELTSVKVAQFVPNIVYKRVSQQFIGQQAALDIQVDCPDHLFLLANGLIVSNSKHVGGTGGKANLNPEGEDQPTGMPQLERIFYVPSTFKGGAVLAKVDGVVNDIKAAPQGGNYITVGTNTVYAPRARTVKVAVGDKVTAGDRLTSGIPNPAQVVEYKGLGTGRRYFVDELNRTLNNNKWGVNKRNLEQFARGFLNKVKITDPDGFKSYLPGDIVDYSDVQSLWKPRQDSVSEAPQKALNKYLDQPALFYTVGTRVTPEVADNLKKYKFDKIEVNDKAPPFESIFVRSNDIMLHDKNWIPRMMGERLKEGLFDAAQQGMTDTYDSPSYIDKVVVAPYKP